MNIIKLFSKYFLTLSLLLTPLCITHADTIPPNSYPVERCSKIVNTDQFPEINLIGFIRKIMGRDKYEAYPIEQDQCLHKGYKFNGFFIYYITANKFDPENIEIITEQRKNPPHLDRPYRNYSYPKDFQSLTIPKIEITSVYRKNATHPHEQKYYIDYSLIKDTEGNLTLYKSQETLEYIDDTPPKITTFPAPFEDTGDIPLQLDTASLGFRIKSLFQKIQKRFLSFW